MYTICVCAAIAVGLLLGVPSTLVALVGSPHRRRTLTLGVLVAALIAVSNGIAFCSGESGVGFTTDTLYASYWLWLFDLVLVAAVLSFDSIVGHNGGDKMWRTAGCDKRPSAGSRALIAVALVAAAFGLAIDAGGVFTSGRAKALAQTLNVQVHNSTGDLPNTDTTPALIVPPEIVHLKVEAALKGEAATKFTVDSDSHPSVINNHTYWVTGIHPVGTVIDAADKVYGYVTTDAEDLAASSQYRSIATNSADHPKGWSPRNISRLIWNKYRGHIVSNLHLEIDDDWQPWFVATLGERPLSFRMGTTFPKMVIVVNPTTGDIREYKLSNAPAWIDQNWSAAEVKAAVGYWGRWKWAGYSFWHEGPAKRYRVTGSPQAIATPNGITWQVLMTAQSRKQDSEAVVSYNVLVNARTGIANAYRMPELRPKSQVTSTIQGSPANQSQAKPTYLTLCKIDGVMTWIAPLLWSDPKAIGSPKPNSRGLAALPAERVVSTAVVLREDGDLRGLSRDYRQSIAIGSGVDSSGDKAMVRTATGTVSFVGPNVSEQGVVVTYFILAETPGVEYRVEVNLTREVKYLKPGNTVTVTYRDTGRPPYNAVNYDDLALEL